MMATLVWCTAVFVTAQAAPGGAVVDRILAVVNGDIITWSDVRAARLLKLGDAGAGDDDTYVRMLVERRLVLAEVRRFQTGDVDADSLDARRTQWIATLGGADGPARLTQAGVTQAFVDRWLEDDLRREAYVQQRFAALPPDRRDGAARQWLESLRLRADIVYRLPDTQP